MSVCDLLKLIGPQPELLMPAPDYPALLNAPVITQEMMRSGKRIFIEYPAEVPGLEFGEALPVGFERTVVMSDELGVPGSILVQHGCWRRMVKTPVKPLLGIARVAGYRHAVYGLPSDTEPMLFTHPEYPNVMICTSGISNFIRGRYAPMSDWRRVWNYILN